MLITKEQQQALIDNYISQGHNRDECIGFIDGVERTMELIDKVSKNRMSLAEVREIILQETRRIMSEDKGKK